MSGVPLSPVWLSTTEILQLYFFYRLDLTRFQCIEEQLTVPLGLLSIQFCKGPNRPVKGIGFPDIPIDHRCITGSGMGTGKSPAAKTSIPG